MLERGRRKKSLRHISILNGIIHHNTNRDDWWVLWYWINSLTFQSKISSGNTDSPVKWSYRQQRYFELHLQLKPQTIFESYLVKPSDFVRHWGWIFYKSFLWSAFLSCTDWLHSSHSTWNIKGIMLSVCVHCSTRKILQNLLFIKAIPQ